MECPSVAIEENIPSLPHLQVPGPSDNLLKRHDDMEQMKRVEVLPEVGMAIFWWNLDPNGVGDDDTLHAGSPVINGTKIGLNIWTRERAWRNVDYDSD